MKDTEVFEGKKLSELLKDIHDNALTKRDTILGVITTLTGLLKTANQAVMLAPIIREFYDVSVKNDEQLVKIATIAQRVITAESYNNVEAGDVDSFMSEKEKDQLIANAMAGAKTVSTELSLVREKLNEKISS